MISNKPNMRTKPKNLRTGGKGTTFKQGTGKAKRIR